MNSKRVDIIVPCYNEEPNIEAFFENVQAVSAKISEDAGFMNSYDFSYIFVDDGSTDGTLEQIKLVAERGVEDLTAVKYISFSRNFGKEAAMFAGIKASASGPEGGTPSDLAIIMDADLQHPPELIIEMLKKMEETGCDTVAARRVTRKGEPRIRSAFARLFYKIMNKYCEIEIADGAVDFRLMNHAMVKAVAAMPETQRFSKGIFAWVGFDTQWVEFQNVKRLSGESKWSVWKLTKYAIDGFIDFADSPLKFVGAFGGVIAAGSAIYLIVEIIKVLIMGKDTPGYASTICLILFFGGMIIAILGLIGEYIGRMYMETKRRPVYIKKDSNIEEDK
ncbi:MAG: glycosyltransferase family 2 protein [Bacillota bacterium]|nr:glycosyltransferase family 2 protein [Bacillota bacterium]